MDYCPGGPDSKPGIPHYSRASPFGVCSKGPRYRERWGIDNLSLFVVVIYISFLTVIAIRELIIIGDQAVFSPSPAIWTPMGNGEGFAVSRKPVPRH